MMNTDKLDRIALEVARETDAYCEANYKPNGSLSDLLGREYRKYRDQEYARRLVSRLRQEAEPVGTAENMPGTSGGFTIACFDGKRVPVGAKLYTFPPEQPAQSAEVPAGMVLVPIDATVAMIDAAEALDWSDSDVRGNLCNQWNAMLAAAPARPVGEIKSCDTCAIGLDKCNLAADCGFYFAKWMPKNVRPVGGEQS